MNKAVIYSIDNIVTGKSYIGSSINVEQRKKRHFKNLKLNNHDNDYLQNSFNKHGVQSFVFTVLEFVEDVSNLKKVEQQYLDVIRLMPEFYYNINYKADRINYTLEVRRKLSESSKRFTGEKNGFFGKSHTKETKLKIKNKISSLTVSKKTKEKMSSSAKLSWSKFPRPPSKIDNNIYTFKNDNSKETFIGTRVELYRKYGLKQDAICRVVNGIYKHHKGWRLC